MDESYKEMYIYLYKHMAILQRILKRLSMRIEDSLDESAGIYMEHLDKEMKDSAEIEKRFANLLEIP